MFGFIVRKYKSSKGLLNYFLLTYLDKIISFALPLSILFIIKDKELYSFVEVAFSYASLVMIIIELGVSNYLFFGYKNAADKELFLEKALSNFKFLLLAYCVFLIPCIFSMGLYDKDLLSLFVIVSIRALFMLYLSFFSNIFRLKDNPVGIYSISIIVNVVSFMLLVLANQLDWSAEIYYFFLPSALLILFVALRFLFFESAGFRLKDSIFFLGEALKFSWPIIINVLAMSYINNYAKIYAYGHLSQEEMVQISYIMRIGLIIQLSHASFSSYFSKSIFMDTAQRINYKIFKQYSLLLMASLLLVLGVIFATNLLFAPQIYIPVNSSTVLFLLYILLWCYIGYLEIYFGMMNANRRVLYYSIISSVAYTILLKTGGEISVFQLSLYMVISALLNLTLVIFGLRRIGITGASRS